jgi:hypothetical protein
MFRPTMTSTEPGVPTAAIANGPYRHPRPPRCPHILSGRPPFGSGDRRVGAAALIPALPDTTGWLSGKRSRRTHLPPRASASSAPRRASTRHPIGISTASEGGLEPFAYAQILSAEFAIGGLVMTARADMWGRRTTTGCAGLPGGYRSGSSRCPAAVAPAHASALARFPHPAERRTGP